MATFTHSQTPALFSSVAKSLASALDRLKAARARRRVFRETYAELASCSDAELADIGIPRCSIRYVARQHADMV
jgi:uncharacterized protein YjiS (DUF1127 family)